jgi:heme oxygenase (mycobilin-producing)
MAVQVFITRKFKADKVGQANRLLMELRSMATLRKGYMSGQTLVAADDPNKVIVISTWSSRQRWEDWYQDPNRVDFSKKLGAFLETPETSEVYLVGEKMAEWVDMA